MVGLGNRKDYIMYHWIEDKELLRRAQTDCSKTMKELEVRLREVYGINSQCFLVGSGGRNMITQNGNKPIDFDYNLNIISSMDWDGRYLKESVIKAMNKIMNDQGLGSVSDSTSAVTTKPIYFKDDPDIKFSMDICIVCKDDDGNWHRLIHHKTGFADFDQYYWNIAPNSAGVAEKAKYIKQHPGMWDKVRQEYLRLKNHYLQWNDYNHPSFICYIEAVNNIYNQI